MDPTEIKDHATVISSQYKKVKALAAFAALKQSELRPGNDLSVHGFLAAEEELRVESAILDGHVQLLEERATKLQIKLSSPTRRLITTIRSRSVAGAFSP